MMALACVSIASAAALSVDKLDGFLAKEEQPVQKRVVASYLAPVDSFPLSAYDAFESYSIAVDDYWIYAPIARSGRVLAVSKEDFESFRLIGRGTGEGPGEMKGLRGLDVSRHHIVLGNQPHKVARFNKAGQLVGQHEIDHRPSRLRVSQDGRVLTFDPNSPDYLFRVLGVDGTVLHEMVDMSGTFEELGPGVSLRLSGFVDFHDDHVYYACYSESLLKKFSLDGTEVFSVSTIDNHSSEANYAEAMMGEFRTWTYSDAAIFSTIRMEVYGRYCLLKSGRDADGVMPRCLDLYDTDTGRYVRSYGFSRPPIHFVAGDEHLYLLLADLNPRTGERDKYVKIYENVLRDR